MPVPATAAAPAGSASLKSGPCRPAHRKTAAPDHLTGPGLRHAPGEAALVAEQLYNGTQAAQLATEWRRFVSAGAAAVTRSAICNWRTRGHLGVAGLDERGHPLYDLADIARAEKATREVALHPERATRRARTAGPS